MIVTATEYGRQAERLIVRGVPPEVIASRLALLPEEVAALSRQLTESGAVERYQRECVEQAGLEGRPDEAANYLFVRGLPTFTIRTLWGLPEDFEFDLDAKFAYQQEQVEKALERIGA